MEPPDRPSIVDRLNRPLHWPAAGRWLRELVAQIRWAVSRPGTPALAFVLFLLAAISRRPDLITRGQFYAEDGALFFVGAQDRGLLAVGEVYNGYLHLLPRLIALVATWMPLEDAPSVMNLLSLSVAAASATYVVFRLNHLRWAERLVLGMALLAVPRVYEMFGNAANLQWFLVVVGCVLVAARPPRSERVRRLDWAVAVLFGLSSPLVVLVAGWAGVRWRQSRDAWSRERARLLGGAAAIQVFAMLLHPRATHHTTGASADVLIQVMYAQFAGPLFGSVQWLRLADSAAHWVPRVAVIAVALGFLGYGLWRGPAYLRTLIVLGVTAAVLGFVRPLREGTASEFVFDHLRYFYLLHAAVLSATVWSLAHLLRERRRGAVALTAITLLLLGPNLLRAWSLTPSRDLGHRRQVEAARLEQRGEMTLWILPPGWKAKVRL